MIHHFDCDRSLTNCGCDEPRTIGGRFSPRTRFDYADITTAVAETIAKGSGQALTDAQRLVLAGSMAVFVQRAYDCGVAEGMQHATEKNNER